MHAVFFISKLIFIHVFNTQPQLGVPRHWWPVGISTGAAERWIQTSDPRPPCPSPAKTSVVSRQKFSLILSLQN